MWGCILKRVLEPAEAMVSLSFRSWLLLTRFPQMRSKGWQVEFTLTARLKISTQSDANSDPDDVFDRSLPLRAAFPRATFPLRAVVAPSEELDAAEQV